MDRLRRSLRNSFRRRSDDGTLSERHASGAGGSHRLSGDDGNKPPVWSQDEASVRAGTCTFKVKYLGCVEVYESRGMQVCEEALKVLRNNRRRPIKGILYISGDSLRVVDKDSKGLVVDQTIEKVSFCAPDRHHEKGFAYICRDGTTRRWLCYGFHARKNTGERLSHAVGCAFAVCLEKKQKRDREAQRALPQSQLQSIPEFPTNIAVKGDSATANRYNSTDKGYHNSSSFQRNSYRYASLQERLQDPQNVKPAEKPPVKPATNPHAVARPRGNKELFERQGSLRLPNDTDSNVDVPPLKNGAAPEETRFRRFQSLRLNQLPSNLARLEGMSSQAFGRGAIGEEDSLPNTPVINTRLETSRPINSSFVSPTASELSSPSSGTLTSPSPFDATKASSVNDTVSPQRVGSMRSRGDEWLQTTASQVKFWQQVRGVSPPTTDHNSTSAIPSISGDHLPPPTFPPPPLPPSAVVAAKKGGSTDSAPKDAIPTRTGAYSNNWITFEDKWNSLESPPHKNTYPNAPLSPSNPFVQESSAVNI